MSSRNFFRDQLRAAVALQDVGHERPLFPGRAAAVLVLFRHPTQPDPELLLTRRTETVETHKGQIAFPGGAVDPEDHDDPRVPGVVTAALRETEEEVGLPRTQVEVMGTLPDLWTPSGFVITPVVGVLEAGDYPLELSPHEIADAFWVPLSLLRNGNTYRLEHGEHAGRQHPIHVYQIGANRVWGATAAVIKNLLDRLDRLVEGEPETSLKRENA